MPGFQRAPRAIITAAGPGGASAPLVVLVPLSKSAGWLEPSAQERQLRQKSEMWLRLKKSPFAMTGICTALHTSMTSCQWAGVPLFLSSSCVRRCTATAAAPLRSQSCMKSRVFASVGSSRILQVTAYSAGSSLRRDFRMSAASSGLPSSAAPMPPVALKGAVQPIFTSMPRTSRQTLRAACVASAESAVPTWKMRCRRSSSHVLKITRFSEGET
mmetsp:Transcript_66567/g.214530  ORF Transcript_66567/g.214530 Transcript_66567/m.214530 type:complete len:215 (+) Transcript_66567:349-993(+)